jgi:hypothetical protein
LLSSAADTLEGAVRLKSGSEIAGSRSPLKARDWRGHVNAPKGGRLRHVPMTARLSEALQTHRHTRSLRVLCPEDGSPLTQDIVGEHVRRLGRKIGDPGERSTGFGITFCSHLAMRCARARAI